MVENKLNVTLFAGNPICFSAMFLVETSRVTWGCTDLSSSHRRSRSHFLCVMLHLHIQWSATREQRSSSMIGGDLYRVSNIFNFSTSEVLDLWPDHPRVCEAWLWYRPGRLDFPIISDSGVYICIMYNYIYIYIFIYLFTSVRNSGRLWYITYITYKTCITYWLVSPCKVRPCGLLCPRALSCEWWPWTPWRPWCRRHRFGRGAPGIAAKMLSWWLLFLLSQTDCHQMEGYGFWTRAAGMIFHRVQRGDLGSLGWQLGDLGSLGWPVKSVHVRYKAVPRIYS